MRHLVEVEPTKNKMPIMVVGGRKTIVDHLKPKYWHLGFDIKWYHETHSDRAPAFPKECIGVVISLKPVPGATPTERLLRPKRQAFRGEFVPLSSPKLSIISRGFLLKEVSAAPSWSRQTRHNHHTHLIMRLLLVMSLRINPSQRKHYKNFFPNQKRKPKWKHLKTTRSRQKKIWSP